MDPSFWDDILGGTQDTLGTLFSDLTDRHATQGYGGQYDSLPQRAAYGSSMSNPFMGALNWSQIMGPSAQSQAQGSAYPVIGKGNVFEQARTPIGQGPMHGGQFQYDTALEVPKEAEPLVQMARQAARDAGIDEDVFVRQIFQESKFDPNATNRSSGAKGLGQLMDPTARELGVTNPYDPQQNLSGSARYLKQQLDRYGGDYVRGLAAYNAGAGTVDSWNGAAPTGEAAIYVNRILTGAKRREAAAAGTPSQTTPGAPEGTPSSQPLHGITPYQYGQEGLATGAADYICGPIAAVAFAHANGRNPTVAEALNMARQMGVIDPVNGMHGVESTANLIRSLGGKATTGPIAAPQIISEIMGGRPVIIDTPNHYFVIEDYDPKTGKFDFGNSARALGSVTRDHGGNTWYTLDEIANLTIGNHRVGPARAAIYAR